MNKKKLSLQTLLNLTEYLEKEISLNQSFVIANNAVLKSKSDNTMKSKVKEHYDKRQKCQQQLQIFKLAKTIANSKEIDGVSNNARIYELSDLKRDERFISVLLGQKTKTKKGTVVNYVYYIPKSELKDELLKIEDRITKLKNQMSEFNESYEVEVEVNKDLNLI